MYRSSPGEGSAGNDAETIIVFPRHQRDEIRMRRVALEVLESHGAVVSVRFLNRTSLEIVFYLFLKRTLRNWKKNEEVFFAPRLAWGWSLDAGLLRGSQRLANTLSGRFPRISHVIVGDSHQESSFAVKLLVQKTGAKLVLSPEGIGVFRAKFGKYSWVLRNRSAAVASVARSLIPLSLGSSQSPKLKGFSILWRLQRVVDLIAFTGRSSLEHLRIPQADILVSDWPGDIETGIAWRTHLPEWGPRSATAPKGPSVREEAVGIIFIHQPIMLSSETWARVLKLVPNPISPVILVKAHRNLRGLEEFSLAVRQRFTSCVIRVVSEGIAEDLILSRQPEYLVGLTSTVLFNVALTSPTFAILSLADALLLHSSRDEIQKIAPETGHQLAALKALGESRVEFPT